MKYKKKTFVVQDPLLQEPKNVPAAELKVLDKDSFELKVLAIEINSEVKKAFGCSGDKSSSSWENLFIPLFVSKQE